MRGHRAWRGVLLWAQVRLRRERYDCNVRRSTAALETSSHEASLNVLDVRSRSLRAGLFDSRGMLASTCRCTEVFSFPRTAYSPPPSGCASWNAPTPLLNRLRVTENEVERFMHDRTAASVKLGSDAGDMGGYNTAPNHNTGSVSVERLRWMMEAAHQHGKYPLAVHTYFSSPSASIAPGLRVRRMRTAASGPGGRARHPRYRPAAVLKYADRSTTTALSEVTNVETS